MTIVIGSWIFPTLVSLAAIVFAFWPQKSSGYGGDIIGAMWMLIAVIITLASWLVWALLA